MSVSRTLYAAPSYVIASLCLTWTIAHAQTSAGGSIRGRVADQSGAVVASALIVAASPNVAGAFHAVTDAAGAYRLLDLPPATDYTVTAEKIGFSKFERKGVTCARRPQHRPGYRSRSRQPQPDGRSHGRRHAVARNRQRRTGHQHQRRNGPRPPPHRPPRMVGHPAVDARHPQRLHRRLRRPGLLCARQRKRESRDPARRRGHRQLSAELAVELHRHEHRSLGRHPGEDRRHRRLLAQRHGHGDQHGDTHRRQLLSRGRRSAGVSPRLECEQYTRRHQRRVGLPATGFRVQRSHQKEQGLVLCLGPLHPPQRWHQPHQHPAHPPAPGRSGLPALRQSGPRLYLRRQRHRTALRKAQTLRPGAIRQPHPGRQHRDLRR